MSRETPANEVALLIDTSPLAAKAGDDHALIIDRALAARNAELAERYPVTMERRDRVHFVVRGPKLGVAEFRDRLKEVVRDQGEPDIRFEASIA